MSRSGICGKAHRLGLESRGVTGNRLVHDRRAPPRGCATVPVPKPLPAPILETPEPLSLDILTIRDKQCKYPTSDAPYTFCGHPVKDGSWCEFHRRIVFHKGASAEDVAKAIAARDASRLRKSGLG